MLSLWGAPKLELVAGSWGIRSKVENIPGLFLHRFFQGGGASSLAQPIPARQLWDFHVRATKVGTVPKYLL